MERILVVDDEDIICRFCQEVLAQAGYSVETANDGKEAFDKLLKRKADLLLMDWNMPEMDGEALCQRIRQTPALKDMPVILMSVRSSDNDQLEAYHFGVETCLTKPFDAAHLLSRVRAVLRGRSPQQAG